MYRIPVHINMLILEPVALKADFNIHGITAITGPTGSGKTTLLRAIAGLIHCDVAAATCTALAGRKLGYAPQQPLLFPHLTVLRNVAFGLEGPDRQSRALTILGRFGLGHLSDKMPLELSAGQAQLVCVARCWRANRTFCFWMNPRPRWILKLLMLSCGCCVK